VSRLGSPASHGCVRLETANAEIFYTLVREVGPGNTRIIVQD
jgi:lipoprotein-anchoring transpeptidase ErfK/SrfK